MESQSQQQQLVNNNAQQQQYSQFTSGGAGSNQMMPGIDRRQSQLQLESSRQTGSPLHGMGNPMIAGPKQHHHHPPQQKKKPPLPSPFLSKYDSSSLNSGGNSNQTNNGVVVSNSKLSLYSQAQIQQAQMQALGGGVSLSIDNNSSNGSSSGNNGSNPGKFSLKTSHQISSGHIPTIQQQSISIPSQQSSQPPSTQASQQDEEFRQTWGKMKPKISKQLPAPFNAINKTSKAKGKKAFQQFKVEVEAQQTDNFYLDKLDSAVTAEEYKQMQNLLQPLNLEPERKDKMERALTKIESYNSGSSAGGVTGSLGPGANQNKMLKKGGGLANLDPLPQLDGLTKILQNTSEKHLLSQSSGFSTYDTYTLKALQQKGNQPGGQGSDNQSIQQQAPQIRLDQMITLAVFKSTSGTVKKMLHAPSLKIYTIKEVPIANRDTRQMLKDWIGKWEHNCTTDQYVKIHQAFWNSPEGCVSVVTDYAGCGSLHNLVLSIGALPESILKHLAKQILRSLDYMHDQGLTHNNICCSQVLFDRKGKVKIGAGFQHILKMKGDNYSTLNQNSHNTLIQLLCEGTENFKNRSNLLKDKFQVSSSLNQQTSSVSQGNNSVQNEGKKESSSTIELKKLDLFDLGVLLIIAATGGLDVISEESINSIPNLSQSCCILHAVQGSNGSKTPQGSKAIILMRRILNRLSTQAQDFICKCLQQRFSQNEIKKEGKPAKLMTTSDMLTHSWILTESAMGQDQKQQQQKLKLTLRELLSVSSDWKDVNQKNAAGNYSTGGNGNSAQNSGLPMDFQSQQIERIVEAIALTLPNMGGGNIGQMLGGGTISSNGTNSQESQNTLFASLMRFDEHCIRELAFDLGVDTRALKQKLATIFFSQGGNNGDQQQQQQIEKINNMQFNF